MHKYVYLDGRHNEFVVDEETYEQIAALVQTAKLCTYNHEFHPYSLENPCVGRNICLEHLLVRQHHLTLLDSPSTNSEGQHFYRFADNNGVVYTTTEDVSEEASKNIGETLACYGFTPPLTIASRGKSVDFHTYYATLYGDLNTASVIVLSYNQYSEKVKGLFLLYKDGSPKELSRKSELYHRADGLLEATKNEKGEYVINGRAYPIKYDAHIFEIISQLESAMYNVSRKLQNGNQKTSEV